MRKLSIEFIGPPGVGKTTVATQLISNFIPTHSVSTNRSLSHASPTLNRRIGSLILTTLVKPQFLFSILFFSTFSETRRLSFFILCTTYYLDNKTESSIAIHDQGIINYLITQSARKKITPKQIELILAKLLDVGFVLPTHLVYLKLPAQSTYKRNVLRKKHHAIDNLCVDDAREFIEIYNKITRHLKTVLLESFSIKIIEIEADQDTIKQTSEITNFVTDQTTDSRLPQD